MTDPLQSSHGLAPGPVLCIGEFPEASRALLQAAFELVTPAQLDATPALRDDVRAIVTRSVYAVPRALLETLPALRIVAFRGVGYDGIDQHDAAARGLVVTHTPDVLNAAVAELALGLTLCALRRLPQADRFVREGRWTAGMFALATSLAGKRAGIVGHGRIGREIVRRLQAFDVNCAYHGPRDQRNGLPYFANVVELAADSDVLIVCCPGNTATRHMIGKAVLDALGPQGTLVNVARGSVVDETALVAALRDARLGAAALDVYATEPLDTASPLLSFDNVVLTPHIASATHETRLKMAELTRDNVLRFFSAGHALTPVALPSQPVAAESGNLTQ
jgi:lactate dehydrogenase-like 2-hydroxyacid dehydrogenase